MTSQLDQDVRAALDTARALASMGVPIFAAPPDPSKPVGFALPSNWQHFRPEQAEGELGLWQPGWALCAVMGHGLDLVDIDPRSGGAWPEFVPATAALGFAATPSGGLHGFVPSLGLRSRDAVLPGVDYKGGTAGEGHGFAFIAPTVKPSKVDGTLAGYVWIKPPAVPADRAEGVRNWQALEPLRGHIAAVQAASMNGNGHKPPADPDDLLGQFWTQREAQSRRTAEGAISRALAEAAQPAVPGQGYRQRLMRAALTLGGYVGAGVLDGSDAAQRLFDAAGTAWDGVGDDEDRLWIHQGLTDGQQRPFHVYDEAAPDPLTGLPPAAAYSLEHVRRHGVLPEVFDPSHAFGNEHVLAEAVLAFLYPNVRMDSESGAWLVRGSERWFTVNRDAAGWAITEVAPRMPVGLRPVPKDPAERTPEHWQAARHGTFHSSRGSAGIASKIRALLAADGHPSHVRLSELDADAEVLWAAGQPWDLRTGQLAEIDPLTPHTHSARFAPVEGPTPLWDAFVAAVWPDAEIREWALQVLAVGLTGHSARIMPILYGPPGRGKTQVVALLADLLGTYGGPADQKLIIAPEAHGSVVYSLKGLRLAYIDEPAPTHRDKVERVKLLTGGGQLTGNMMRKDPVTWKATHTLILMQNDAPELTDDALRDRARVVACDGDPDAVARTRAAIGHTDSEAWRREAPGVLAAMIDRAGRWLTNTSVLDHSATPAGVMALVDEIVREQDPVRRWMEARTAPAEPGTKARELHDDFAAWFKASPEFGRRGVPSLIDFGRRLTKLGVGITHREDGKYRHLQLNGPAGGWVIPPMATPTQARLTDADGCLTNAEGSPVSPESQASTEVDHKLTDLTDTAQFQDEQHTFINQAYNGGYREQSDSSVSSVSPTGPDLGIPSLTNPSAMINSPGTALAVPETPSAPVKRSRSATSAAALAKREEKALAKRTLVEQLAGPVLELPAVVQRTTPTPRSVPHVAAGSRLADLIEKSRGHLTVDVENTGYPIGHPDHALRTIQLGTRVAAFDFDATCGDCREVVRRALARATTLHAHNAPADLSELAHAGLGDLADMWARMEDTVLPAKLADPSSSGGDPALKAASAAVLGDQAMSPAADEAREALFKAAGWSTNVDPTDPVMKSGWYQVNPRCSTMISYACSDVLDGALLALELPAPDPAVHAREKAVQVIVSRPAALGFPLDRAAVLDQNELHENALDTLLRRVQSELGIDNPGSPKQVGERLLAMGAQLPATATGKPSVAKDVLSAMAGAWELPDGSEDATVLEPHNLAQHAARLILDWRKHDTVLKLILRPWKIATTHGDGRIRPTVYTLGADTGRMSCVRPNMQQVSKKGGVRECIAADDGMSIISADFSGVELRVAAALSGDRMLRHAIDTGLDIHRMIASQVFGEDYADANRTLAKRIVFGRIYGGGVPTLAKQAGVPQSIAAAAVDVMDSITPDLAQWSEQVRSGIRAGHRQFQTYAGRVIHLDPKLPHKGPNYLIQGTARELLVDALLRWERGPWGGGIVMPVHDEVVAMVPEAQADDALAHLLECMTLELNGIPIAAESGGAPARTWHSG